MTHKVIILGNFLSKHGHTIQVCERLFGLFKKNNFNISCASDIKNRFLRLFHMVTHVLITRDNSKIVLIDTFSGLSFFWAYSSSLACRLTKKKYLCILHGGRIPEMPGPFIYFFKSYLKNSWQIVCPSPYIQKFIEKLGFSGKIIFNPIPTGKFPFKSFQALSPNLLWVRRYHKIYNPILAVEVINILLKNHPGAKLTMAGPDSGEKINCMARAKTLKIENSVTFLDRQSLNGIINLAKTHSIFINTTNFDNIPVTLIEMGALGIPIITTAVGGIPELYNNKNNAILVPPNNPEAMAKAIHHLIKNPDLARKMTANSKKLSAMHDENQVFLEWKNILETSNQ